VVEPIRLVLPRGDELGRERVRRDFPGHDLREQAARPRPVFAETHLA
jgi:hypothetical protein